jgi:hypothetical protein
MPDEIVPIDAKPVRRSGASNVAPAHLQTEFINAARAAMGQPDVSEVTTYLGERVTIVFNGERHPVSGVLTGIVSLPGGINSYLVLDNNEDVTYALNSIQSIGPEKQVRAAALDELAELSKDFPLT